MSESPCYPILPPFILRHIARAGDKEDKQRARTTLTRDRQIRAARMELMAQHAHDHDVTIVTVPSERKNKKGGLRRAVYTYTPRATPKLPGKRVRGEGRPACGDAAADEAYDGLGAAYHFFRDAFGRRSVDNDDLPLIATVHYSTSYNNAFWNGDQMVFGDGDSKFFHRFTGSLEIIGHELTHGIMQYSAQMQYTLQAGAVHESICDVMGSLLKQWAGNQTAAAADWLIGTGLLLPGVNGTALRSMRSPGSAFDDPILGKDPQPGHMDGFRRTSDDNGGVHINSGIPNRAFYLAATQIGGYAWAHAGQIWYHTLCDKRLHPHYGFKRFARLTIQNAETLYGADSLAVEAVRAAWIEVGVPVDDATP
ncbi:MAG: M4 family metallopeptidase [Chloroflexota bacterium]|nr:M4 family metallopeptidase [Chloroflexota bacterium]